MKYDTENKKIDKRVCSIRVRLTLDERQSLEKKYNETTCRCMSEYIRKSLLAQKVTVLYRNGSFDKFMEEMILLRKELNHIGNNFNQVARKINAVQGSSELGLWASVGSKLQQQLLDKTDAIKLRINQFSDIWLHDS